MGIGDWGFGVWGFGGWGGPQNPKHKHQKPPPQPKKINI